MKAREPVARALLGITALLLLSPLQPAFAEGLTTGKYSGTMSHLGGTGKTRTDGIEIKIDKVEGLAAQGTVTRLSTGPCRGDVPVTGVIEGDKLTLKTDRSAGEVKEGCGVNFELIATGNKLEGKSATGSALMLSK